MAEFAQKRAGYEIGVKTFVGQESGATYVVLKTLDGSYHVFVETEAGAAARDCGAKTGSNTRSMWDWLWRSDS